MVDLPEKLAEQWRLMRQAPIPYAAALVVLSGLIFAAFQWGYGRVIEQKDANIGSLASQIKGLTDERDGLRRQLTERQPRTVDILRDPDRLYQYKVAVAYAPGGTPDRATGLARFPRIIGGPDFNIQSEMDYREFKLTDCQHGSYGSQSSLGVITQQFFSDVVCRISGLHI